MEKILFFKYSNERADEFSIRTEIIRNVNGSFEVRKVPSSKSSYRHIERIFENYKILEKIYKNSIIRHNHCKMRQQSIYFEFLEGNTFEEILKEKIARGHEEEVITLIDCFFKEIQNSYTFHEFSVSEDFIKIFGECNGLQNALGCGKLNIDLIFSNVIVCDDKWNIIDYEWVFDFDIPFNYIIYRALHQFFLKIQGGTLSESFFYDKYDITSEEISIYEKMDISFQNYVKGNKQTIDDVAEYWNKDLLLERKKILGEQFAQIYYDYGMGYRELDSYKVAYCNLDDLISIRIPIPAKVCNVRIDPCDCRCILHVVNFKKKVDSSLVNIDYKTNGTVVKDCFVVFHEDDPMLMVHLPKNENAIFIEIEFRLSEYYMVGLEDVAIRANEIKQSLEKARYQIEKQKIEKAELRRDLDWCIEEKDRIQGELDASRKALQRVNEELQCVYASRSWKIINKIRSIFPKRG